MSDQSEEPISDSPRPPGMKRPSGPDPRDERFAPGTDDVPDSEQIPEIPVDWADWQEVPPPEYEDDEPLFPRTRNEQPHGG